MTFQEARTVYQREKERSQQRHDETDKPFLLPHCRKPGRDLGDGGWWTHIGPPEEYQ